MSMWRDLEDYLPPEAVDLGWDESSLLLLFLGWVNSEGGEVQERFKAYLREVAREELSTEVS